MAFEIVLSSFASSNNQLFYFNYISPIMLGLNIHDITVDNGNLVSCTIDFDNSYSYDKDGNPYFENATYAVTKNDTNLHFDYHSGLVTVDFAIVNSQSSLTFRSNSPDLSCSVTPCGFSMTNYRLDDVLKQFPQNSSSGNTSGGSGSSNNENLSLLLTSIADKVESIDYAVSLNVNSSLSALMEKINGLSSAFQSDVSSSISTLSQQFGTLANSFHSIDISNLQGDFCKFGVGDKVSVTAGSYPSPLVVDRAQMVLIDENVITPVYDVSYQNRTFRVPQSILTPYVAPAK